MKRQCGSPPGIHSSPLVHRKHFAVLPSGFRANKSKKRKGEVLRQREGGWCRKTYSQILILNGHRWLVIQRKKEGDPGVMEGLYIPPVLGRGPHLVHSELAGESFHYGSSAVRKSCVTHRFCWPLGHTVALRIADCQLHPCTLRLRTKPTTDGKHSICPEHTHSTYSHTHTLHLSVHL